MQRFWIVVADQKALGVAVRHQTYPEASAEAERLCAEFDGRFLVFELVSAVEPATDPVRWLEVEGESQTE